MAAYDELSATPEDYLSAGTILGRIAGRVGVGEFSLSFIEDHPAFMFRWFWNSPGGIVQCVRYVTLTEIKMGIPDWIVSLVSEPLVAAVAKAAEAEKVAERDIGAEN